MSATAESGLTMVKQQAQVSDDSPRIVLLGTSALGGVAAVIQSYGSAGLFDRWPVQLIKTHCDGSAWRKLMTATVALTKFAGLLLRGRVAAVHVHSASNASFWRKCLFMLMAFAARVPVIYHLHGGGFMYFYEECCGPLRRRIVRGVLDRASVIVVLSAEWQRRIRNVTSNPNVRVISNPVDPALLSFAAESKPSETVLFVGRLVKEKGCYELIDAFAQVSREHPTWRLQFAGHGEIEALRARAVTAGVADRVDFLGWISGAEKTRRLQHAGIYVLPSWVEGLPMSLLEAMACGLPVIATRVGAVPEVVQDGVNGRLLAPRDTQALASALHELITDEGARRRMGIASSERVAGEFAPVNVLPKVEAIYRSFGVAPRA